MCRSLIFLCACCLTLSSCGGSSPGFRIDRRSPLGVATFAGNIAIVQTFGEGSVSRAPEQVQFITRLLLLETMRRLGQRQIPIRGVSEASLHSGLDASQLGSLVQDDRGWVRHIRSRATYVGAGAGLPVLQPSNSDAFAEIARRDSVPVVLWIINSYEWDAGGWRGELPFSRSVWRFKIRTAVKVLDEHGNVRWHDELSAESDDAETGAGRNYVLYSSTAITDAQATALIRSAVANAAEAIVAQITAHYGGAK
jgi:hypothetical protein